jgi:hypothetical protein
MQRELGASAEPEFFWMTPLSRRLALKLASALAFKSNARAPVLPGLVTLDIASFHGPGLDDDAAFAKALAAIEKASGEAKADLKPTGTRRRQVGRA